MDNTYALNGTEYMFIPMPPTTALPLLTKLGNIIGSGAGGIDLGEVMALVKQKKAPEGNVLEGIATLLTKLTGDDVMYIANTCLTFMQIKKSGESKHCKCNIDVDFIGKTLDLLKVIGQFIMFTYNDFFPGSL